MRGLKLNLLNDNGASSPVAPYVGAWIETPYDLNKKFHELSHPTWVRGLKHKGKGTHIEIKGVAPYVGAWIETFDEEEVQKAFVGRTLRGCVD